MPHSLAIIFCGASSTGKTTLANAIHNIEPKWGRIKEIARDLMSKQGLNREILLSDEGKMLKLQEDILKEQCLQEREFEERNLSYISDRGPDPIIFAEQYLHIEAKYHLLESGFGKESLKRYQKSLVILVWPFSRSPIDDGERMLMNQSKSFDFNEGLRKLFKEYMIPFIELKCHDHEDRMRIIERAMKNGITDYSNEMIENQNLKIVLPCFRPPPETESATRIRSFTFDSKHEITQGFKEYPKGRTNRIIDAYGTDKLVSVDFDSKVNAKLVKLALLKGVWINGSGYNFFGCSSSGINERKCYMWKGGKEEVKLFLATNGDFSKIRTVSKYLARISLFFSEVQITIDASDLDVRIEGDIVTGSANFSDGCGSIGRNLAAKIVQSTTIEIAIDSDSLRTSGQMYNYIPSVLQIRYQGSKGVLALDSSLGDNVMVLRESMKKFDTRSFPEIGLADYSRPYTFGHLNKQYIMLLSGCGVSDEVILKKQQEYIHKINNMIQDKETAVEILQWRHKFFLASAVLQCESITGDKFLRNEINEFRKYLIKKLIEKPQRVLITKSRNVFGVCDNKQILDYGECFFRPVIRGEPRTIRGHVIIGKNPCYLLGDIRKLRAVDCSDYPDIAALEKDFVDCIVFPTKGKQPHSSEIAGSDLDGDQYFVCWDEDIVSEFHQRPPHDYPAAAERLRGEISREKVITYLANMPVIKKTISRINTYHGIWADLEGITSEQCERLGQLFARAIDAKKTGEKIVIPDSLKPKDGLLNNDHLGKPKWVWQKMVEKVNEFKDNLLERITKDESRLNEVSEEYILDLLRNRNVTAHEFELFQFAVRWAMKLPIEEVNNKLQKFAKLIDFGRFTTDELKFVVDNGIDYRVAYNALFKSDLLTKKKVDYIINDKPGNRWRFFTSSDHNNFNWSYMQKALLTCDQTMIIMNMPENITIVIHVLQKLQQGERQKLTDGGIVVYVFSDNFGIWDRSVAGSDYYYNYDDGALQLYQNVITNTFIWFINEFFVQKHKRREQNRARYGFNQFEEMANEVEDILYHPISVDLTRFHSLHRRDDPHPRINKATFSAMEIYVQDDDKSLNYLDTYFGLECNDAGDILFSDDDDDDDDDDEISADEDEDKDGSNVERKVENAVRRGEINTFLQLFDKTSFTINAEIVISLLSNFVKLHFNQPVEIGLDSLEILLSTASHLITEIKENIKLINLMYILNQDSLVSQLIDSVEKKLQCEKDDSFLSIVSNWRLWCQTQPNLGIKLINLLYKGWIVPRLCLTEEESSKNSGIINKVNIANYTSYFGRLQCLSLIEENMIALEKIDSTDGDDIDTESCLVGMKIDYTCEFTEDKYDDQKYTEVTFYRTASLKITKVDSGMWMYVVRMKQTSNPIFDNDVAIGKVVDKLISPLTITLQLFDPLPQIFQTCIKKKKKIHWKLCTMPNINVFSRVMKSLKILKEDLEAAPVFEHHALTDLTDPKQKSCGSQISLRNKELECIELEQSSTKTLNRSQQEAVSSAIRNTITLIHGPPGTGKTEVACEIVKEMRNKKPETIVLVVAETNIAVDNIARRLHENQVRVVRAGNLTNISPDLFSISLEGQCELKGKQLHRRGKDSRLHQDTALVNKILNAAEVVCITCAGAGDRSLTESGIRFEYVIIDEATKATEPSCLPALVMGCKQLVLIGDPCQLSPIFFQSSDENDEIDLPTLSALSQTLLHRLFDVIPVNFLNLQHRMHPELAEFPAKTFYEGKLESGVTAEERPPPSFPWPDETKPLCFVDIDNTPGCIERREGRSYKNIPEVDVIKKLLTKFLQDGRVGKLHPKDIGILTPYVAQAREIKRQVANHIDVYTVDAFQGREKEVIIISTVRNNQNSNLGFTADEQRINVLLTRARRGIVVVGSGSTLAEGSPIWKDWLDQAPKLSPEALVVRNKRHSLGQSQRQGGHSASRGGRARGRGRFY